MTMWQPDVGTDRGDATPLYLQIARAIEADVRSGRLVAGERLPTHRELADRLGVTVGTVSRGYAAAVRGGWLSGEVGRGTFVRRRDDRDSQRLDVGSGAEVDLSVNLPVDAGSPDLARALRALGRRADLDEWTRYRPSQGGPADRAAGRALLARHGVETTADQVVVCAGAQHGLHVALDAVAKVGDTVAAAALTSPGFRPLAERRGLRIQAVAIDGEGIVPESVEEVCHRGPIRALYVVPTLQNPTAATLPAARRRALARLAERFDFVLIEDDIHRLLAADPPPALAALAPEHTVHIASLSKCLAPGLRVGYVSAPARLRERLVDGVWSSLWTVSPITTGLATHWIQDGTLDAAVIRKREEAAARQVIAREILLLPGAPPDGAAAYHLWLELGEGRDALRFAADAAARAVRVTPAHAFVVGRAPAPPAVRIALGAPRDRDQLKRGLQTLSDLLHGEAPAVLVRV